MGFFDIFRKSEIKPYKNTSTITISLGNQQPQRQRSTTRKEEEELSKLRDMILECRTPKYDIDIQHRAQAYTTIRYRDTDMARLFWSTPMHQIKICMYGKEMYEKYLDDEMFRLQSNKEEVMWGSYFNESNIEKYYPIILEVFDAIDNYTQDLELTEQEEVYIKKTAEVLRNVVGTDGKLYVSKANGYIRVHHELSNVEVEYKPYKKKSWLISCGKNDEEYKLLKSLKLFTGNKQEFTNLIALDTPEDIEEFEPIFKDRYERFVKQREYFHPPTKETLSYYLELPF